MASKRLFAVLIVFYGLIALTLSVQLVLVSSGTGLGMFIAYGLPLTLTAAFLLRHKLTFLTESILLLLPFSIKLAFSAQNITLMFPSEALIGITALAYGFNLALGAPLERSFIKNPITLIILLHLGLVCLSLCFTNYLDVALKAAIVRSSYIVIFYFAVREYIRENVAKIIRLYALYGFGLLALTLLTLYRHSLLGFSKEFAANVTFPFFNDHTIYAACLTALAPFFLYQAIFSKARRLYWVFGSLTLIVGVFAASSRASWVSLALSFAFMFLLAIKAPLKKMAIAFGLILIFLSFNFESVIQTLKPNKDLSNSQKAGLKEQVNSITNIRTDVSNMERLNRWSCAWRMALERPWTGFGLGSFQFAFLPYQRESEKTIISVERSADFRGGQGGNAHSDYFGALAEVGFLGAGSFIAFIFAAIFYGSRAYFRNYQNARLLLFLLPSLIAYICNGFFNSFLDVDKAAVLFYLPLAGIAAIAEKNK